ncbi:hypothetical protein BMQ_pBM60046 (plasmid) [Priestia megaterium QM B1551]|uniref:Uncharacterized protein n=1 Tax=Priestia megaterium (strain ATCC 12872 / QMB1551) TaxID=545693 RepID=D5E3V3_PRIM1|nr:hypothetical protein BMQ_pBM60046 [Priestia megaterium QM B1551]
MFSLLYVYIFKICTRNERVHFEIRKLPKVFLSIIRQLHFNERKKPLIRFSDFFLFFMEGCPFSLGFRASNPLSQIPQKYAHL